MKQSAIKQFDMVVIGGGINGAGIAADAAGRGLQVALYEAEDFAGATSSASSKLIHGGLRYLEHYEFRLVKEALAEREVLLRKAPHIISPMRFCLPYRKQLRPAWMLRAGLFLYDHLSPRVTLPSTESLRLGSDDGLVKGIKRGFEYSDCWVDDARLVILNAMEVAERGGEVRNYCRVEQAIRNEDGWQVRVRDKYQQTDEWVKAKILVNAAGPWVEQLYQQTLAMSSPLKVRQIKGSHLVVARQHERAYILQHQDGRVVFVIPYQGRFSLIGTTDEEYDGDPRTVAISEHERDYLLEVYNQYFTNPLLEQDIVWSFSGVRPLCDDESGSPQAITRDYTLSLDDTNPQAPLLSVFGGKLTTYRKLAEAALTQLSPYIPESATSWTKDSYLIGASAGFDLEATIELVTLQCDWLSLSQARRMVEAYGERVWQIVTKDQSAMGRDFGHGLYQRELDYLHRYEFALTAEDVLWRRTKLGLSLSAAQQQAVAEYMAAALPCDATDTGS